MKRFKKIYIEITNICNLKCSFCPNNDLPKKEMTLEQFEIILKKIDKYTDYIYLHVLGEPLMHSQFEKIIELCKVYNKKINITTNGLLLGKYTKILKNVRQINVSLQSLVDINKLDDIVKCSEILSKDVYISYRLWTKNKHEKIIREKINLTKNIFLSEEKEFTWPNLNNQIIRKSGTCLGTKDHIAILVDGTVIPCCLDSEGIINLGNIFKTNLEEILNSNRFKNISEGFKNNKITEELCQKCGWQRH